MARINFTLITLIFSTKEEKKTHKKKTYTIQIPYSNSNSDGKNVSQNKTNIWTRFNIIGISKFGSSKNKHFGVIGSFQNAL